MKLSDYVDKTPDLSGKTIFVTGGTAGLGRQAVSHFASKNAAHIYYSGRSASRAATVTSDLNKQFPNVRITFVEMDLASFTSIDAAVRKILPALDRLDILLCNAGIMATPPELSKDGYEIQFATNHLGHALLIKHLLPVLEHTAKATGDARIVSLTSQGMAFAPGAGIIFDDLKTTQDYNMFSRWTRYGQSKLANILYASELARRYPALSTASVHPGVIITDMVNTLGWFDWAFVSLTAIGRTITPEQGVYNTAWACTVPRTELHSGTYYEPVGEVGAPSKYSNDEDLARRLWEWTQEQIKAHVV